MPVHRLVEPPAEQHIAYSHRYHADHETTSRHPPRHSLLVAACGGGGTAEITDGSYRAFAIAEGAVPDLTPAIAGETLTFTAPGVTTEASLGDRAGSYPVCGTDRENDVISLDNSVVVGDVEYPNPGVFGDCGLTASVRVTLVDLDSFVDGSGVVPFARWVELCDVGDSDC
jgi:hypothetical protein